MTVPVKAGYSYTIEHLLDSGAMETIVPSVDGSTMISVRLESQEVRHWLVRKLRKMATTQQ